MWHNQGEWVACRQYSILIFEYKSLVHLKCYILIQIPSQSDIWLQRYEQFFQFKNNVKHKNLSPLFACNSKSTFPASDSFPLIMSHMYNQCGALSAAGRKTTYIKIHEFEEQQQRPARFTFMAPCLSQSIFARALLKCNTLLVLS